MDNGENIRENPWKTLGIRTVYENPWIRVEEHDVLTPSGKNGTYGKICVLNKAVAILPFDSDGNTWLVGQHRYGSGSYSWEIPMGGIHAGEKLTEAAARELAEETGLRAGRYKHIMRLGVANSFCDGEFDVFFAEDIVQGAPPSFDETEDITVLMIPFLNALDMVMRGEITDSVSVAAILKASATGLARPTIEILHQDEYCIVARKPPGLLVHRSPISRDRDFLLQRVRDQTGKKVYPVNRIDRPTSGLVLFGIGRDNASAFFKAFRDRVVEKTYVALVRGWTDEEGTIDYALRNKNRCDGERQECVTSYRRLATIELPYPVGPYQTARYSIVEAHPLTGRMHQIRKHFAHISHQVIGDTTYGDPKHNRFMRSQFGCARLMLAATELEMDHPFTGKPLHVKAGPGRDFISILGRMGFTQETLSVLSN